MEVAKLEKFEIPRSYEELTRPPQDKKFILSLLLPALLIFGIVVLIPIITGIYMSFRVDFGYGYPFGERFTLTNFTQLLGVQITNYNTRHFWQYTYQTLFFSVVSLVIEFLLGLLFAFLLNKKFKGRGIARTTLLIPWAVPTIASATIFRFEIFNTAEDNGLINSLIVLFGGEPLYFFGTGLAPVLFQLPVLVPYAPYLSEINITLTMFTAIIIDVWKTTPFITLLILATLQIVPEDLNKAGDIAGASGWQKFRYITWPLIKPGVGIALIFRMMQALRVYDAIVVFNDDSVKSMTVQAVNLWSNSDFGLASAVNVMILLFILLFAFIILLFTVKQKRKSSKSLLNRIFKRKKAISYITPDIGIDDEFTKNPANDKKNISQLGKIKLELSDIIIEEVKLPPISEAKIKWYIAKKRLKNVVFYVLVFFMCFFCAAPFVWIVLRSFRDPYIIQTGFELFPKYLSLGAYEVIFERSDVYGVTFQRALFNGAILAGSTVIVVIIVGSLIAYAIAKYKFRLKRILNGFIFSMNSLPPLIIIIPYYIWIAAIGSLIPYFDTLFKGSLAGLVLPYTAFNLPLAVFILIAFFREIPEDLWKAAKVDGASNFQIFRKVILPLTVPGIFTCAILTFIAGWNELLFAQIFLTDPINQTVPVSILRYVRNPGSLTADWNTNIALLAATSISTIPLVIAALIFQKKIVSGLTRGAVKG